MKGSRKSISKSIAKPPDYADRRELKSLYISGVDRQAMFCYLGKVDFHSIYEAIYGI